MRSASSRAGTLSRMQPSRMRSGGPPVLRMFVCPLPTCPSRLLTRSRVSGGTIPAHAAAARSSRSAASIEGLSGSPYRVCCEESAPQPGPISSFSDPFSLATLTVLQTDNIKRRLSSLFGELRETAHELDALLSASSSNAHSTLKRVVGQYRQTVDKPTDELDVDTLFSRGLRLGQRL